MKFSFRSSDVDILYLLIGQGIYNVFDPQNKGFHTLADTVPALMKAKTPLKMSLFTKHQLRPEKWESISSKIGKVKSLWKKGAFRMHYRLFQGDHSLTTPNFCPHSKQTGNML